MPLGSVMKVRIFILAPQRALESLGNDFTVGLGQGGVLPAAVSRMWLA
jgi:hypothetical protein